MAASGKVVLRTAMRGDVFRIDENTEVTYEGTEFSSKNAAAEAVAVAAQHGVQLYVVDPAATEDTSEEERIESALLESGLLDSEPESKSKKTNTEQSGGSN